MGKKERKNNNERRKIKEKRSTHRNIDGPIKSWCQPSMIFSLATSETNLHSGKKRKNEEIAFVSLASAARDTHVRISIASSLFCPAALRQLTDGYYRSDASQLQPNPPTHTHTRQGSQHKTEQAPSRNLKNTVTFHLLLLRFSSIPLSKNKFFNF